jgi:hypothetical protein
MDSSMLLVHHEQINNRQLALIDPLLVRAMKSRRKKKNGNNGSKT